MPDSSAPLSFRDFVADLAGCGWLKEVDKPVDPAWEIACIGRWAAESTREDDAYSIRFNDVIGCEMPVVLGLFASRRHVARSLGVEPSGIWSRWAEALENPVDPEHVASGPTQDVVLRGDQVDLTKLPAPVWTPGRDRAPYLSTACVITADRKDRIQNVGTYRVEIQGPRQVGLSFGSDLQHGAMHHKTWADAGDPAPVALVVGASPVVSYSAAAKVRYGVDELTIAGGLAGAPIPVVTCAAHELRVPADAEIVIEGFIRSRDRAPEGPFGEALGYMEGVSNAWVVDVECVTHRSDAMFHGLIQQVPTTEGHVLMEIGLLGSLWHYLTGRARVAGLVDLGIVEGAAGLSVIAAAVRRGDRASVKAILRAMATMGWGQKLVIVVDEDIDVRDPRSLVWAVSSRADFANDVTILPDVPQFQWDPAAFHRAQADPAADRRGVEIPSSRMLIDATLKSDCMAVALPSRSFMERVYAEWDATGLPPLRGVSGLMNLLARHPEAGLEYRMPPSDSDDSNP